MSGTEPVFDEPAAPVLLPDAPLYAPPRAGAPAGLPFSQDDERVYLDRASATWRCEADDEEGTELEWDREKGSWVPVLDEELVRQQQAAYGVEGVDEEAPAAPIARRQGKRGAEGEEEGERPKRAKRDGAKPKQTTSVYVTGLPLDATVEEIAKVFGRYGVLSEYDGGEARIKIYTTDAGAPKGEALVSFFRPESVDLAVSVLDESCLRAADGKTTPVMRVSKAEWSGKKEAGAEGAPKADQKKKEPRTEKDKKNAQKRFAKLNEKLTDWTSDDEDAGPSKAAEATLSKNARTVILTRMFTLAELDDDPTLLLDLKEDVREECETLGKVTNCTLYDKEPEGIMAVKFSDPIAAAACVQKMNGRFFAGRTVIAYLADGKPKFRRSGAGDEEDDEEEKRADAFGEWLDGGGDDA